MKSNHSIKTIDFVKTNAAKLLDEIQKTRQPVIITYNGEARAVLQDITSYERDRQSLLMLQLLAQGERDLELGRMQSHAKVMSRLEKKLSRKISQKKNA